MKRGRIQPGRWLACLALLWLAAMPAHAQLVSGDTEVVDGDSLSIGERRVRLFGIDAPELDQNCDKDGVGWTCGKAAKEQLAAIIAGRQVVCRGQGMDQHGRILAVCTAGRDELNRIMVEQGWAVAFRQFSDAYIAAELHARTYRLGIWSSSFVAPSDFRHAKLPPKPRPSTPPRAVVPRSFHAANGQCLIKGNHSRRGEWIYHLPGMPYYEQTRGEEMFCSEEEAVAVGYRRSRAGG